MVTATPLSLAAGAGTPLAATDAASLAAAMSDAGDDASSLFDPPQAANDSRARAAAKFLIIVLSSRRAIQR